MKLSDKELIICALNIYAKHLRGFGDKYLEDLQRVEQLLKEKRGSRKSKE